MKDTEIKYLTIAYIIIVLVFAYLYKSDYKEYKHITDIDKDYIIIENLKYKSQITKTINTNILNILDTRIEDFNKRLYIIHFYKTNNSLKASIFKLIIPPNSYTYKEETIK